MGPRQFWSFNVARYAGEFRTTLRFKLTDGRKGTGTPVYSNEFEGSINLEQFTEKEGHSATNVMDPYDD